MPEPLRLWTFQVSPFAGKARAAFAEKGLEIDLHEIHPKRRPARIRELSPIGRVPVLEFDDGSAIFESSVICEWLEDAHPDPALWPQDARLRGWARAWTKWIDDPVVATYILGMRKLAFGAAPEDPDDIVDQLHAKFTDRLTVLERTLGEHDGPWLCGESFTYGDLTGLPAAVRVPAWSAHLVPDPSTHPNVTRWFEALRERPSAAAIDAKGDPVHAAED